MMATLMLLLIFIVPYFIHHKYGYFLDDSSIYKELSTDKPYEGSGANGGSSRSRGYTIIYANGAKWAIITGVDWELHRMYSTTRIDGLNASNADYYCTWLSTSRHMGNVKRIIYTYPNLNRSLYWKIRTLFS